MPSKEKVKKGEKLYGPFRDELEYHSLALLDFMAVPMYLVPVYLCMYLGW
jgi:hypothetical protein